MCACQNLFGGCLLVCSDVMGMCTRACVCVFDVTLFQVGSLIGHDIPCGASTVGVKTRMQRVVALTESLSCKQPALNMRLCFVGTSECIMQPC